MTVTFSRPRLLPSAPSARPVVRVCRILAIALILGAPVVAQSLGSQQGPPWPRSPILDAPADIDDPSMIERQVKLLNIQRQKAIVSDTDKILQLARELNQHANAQDPALSLPERMHKVDEIEKLARSVREKMTNALGVPQPVNAFAPWSVR